MSVDVASSWVGFDIKNLSRALCLERTVPSTVVHGPNFKRASDAPTALKYYVLPTTHLSRVLVYVQY